VLQVDIIAVMAIKFVVKRNRPPYHVTDVRYMGPDQHSFPSGHATRVWCIVAFLLRLAETHPSLIEDFFRASPELVVALAIVWAVAINFSRVALGHHYPSDVLAGSLIGFFVFYPLSDTLIDHFGILSLQ
jgi:membrane-associated phospholipid phosphatase